MSIGLRESSMLRGRARLALNRETIRVLSRIDLRKIAGGMANPSITDEFGKCCHTNACPTNDTGPMCAPSTIPDIC